MNSSIHYLWVENEQQLAEVCQNARQVPAVALDTEFIRERTFYPKLGLIQLFDGKQVSLIDPTAIEDFSPFIALLADQNVIKVLHACSEDLEVFECSFNQLPTPLVDTQVMANFLNLGISVGFAKLVLHYLDIELDKGASRTDWLARPLSETQLQYATADVWYLLPIYQKMQTELAQTNWQNAVNEECSAFLTKREREDDLDKAYIKISNAWRLEPQQ
ncbi:ribonuclease D, partial [Haemophilus paraphrohaemolyticus]